VTRDIHVANFDAYLAAVESATERARRRYGLLVLPGGATREPVRARVASRR
jgi:hypothetical protein